MILTVLWAAFTLSLSVEARPQPQLVAPLMGDRAATLPRGRFLVSFTRIRVSADSRFDGNGQRNEISSEFDKSLTWRDVIESDATREKQLGGLLDSKGVSSSDSAGSVRGDFTGLIDVSVPVLGYGITDRLGIYIAIPIQRVQLRSKVSYVQSESARSLVNRLRAEEQSASAEDMETALNKGFQNTADRAGYDYSENTDRSDVGDIRIEIPYVRKFSGFSSAFIQTLILPTGNVSSLKDFYGINSGEGRYQIGSRGVIETSFLSRGTLSGSAGFQLPFSAKTAIRLPSQAGDLMSSDFDSAARITGGERAQIQVQAKWQVARSWTIATGAQHQVKNRDQYDGTIGTAESYRNAGVGTSERLTAFFMNVELDTISAFLSGDIPVPFRLMAGGTFPVAGMNTGAERSGNLQMNLFF